ncbi:hypothetical protein GCM10011506_42940 [Marivirga lumbricoides]|uniref:histidine kinase n=1 Tax=Marivirga lumbricoides TaxID=1046115 RepID=A0ABQ1N6N5_9BACT|nr:hypothetical protein GCM10011506_42940 [Marivirga lumbricoides]
MFIKVNSIRGRIFLGFLLIILLSLIIFLLNYSYLVRIDSIRKTERELNNIELKTLRVIKLDNDFLDIESINASYFETRESVFLDKRDSLMSQLFDELTTQQNQNSDYFSIRNGLRIISATLETYNSKFRVLADNVYQRGFKDYGLEGEMREYAHQLEDQESVDLSLVLSLRRHEKDFFLRNDQAYIDAFNSLAQTNILKLEKQKADSAKLRLLKSYVNSFNELVKVQKTIGLNSNEGLRKELNDLTISLGEDFAHLSESTSGQSNFLIKSVFIVFVISIVVCLIIALVVSYFLSAKLSDPIKRLSGIMEKYMNSNDKSIDDFQSGITKPAREIEKLSDSFFMLMHQREYQLNEIESKSQQMALKNDELEKLNDELDKFIYSTAHDLRSPLSSILGLINLLEYDTSHKSKIEYAEMMKNSISKMELFIKDVVDYSKNKKLEIENAPLNIRKLIEDVLEEHRFIPSYKYMTIQTSIEGDGIVYTDYNRLKIIFNNLVSNAIRYSDSEKEERFIHIKISYTEGYFKMLFEDNGQGISELHLKKIFNMFYRANEKSEGSGLGLFILKETIMKLEGNINVNSELKVGTVFEINIPNKVPKNNEPLQLKIEPVR